MCMVCCQIQFNSYPSGDRQYPLNAEIFVFIYAMSQPPISVTQNLWYYRQFQIKDWVGSSFQKQKLTKCSCPISIIMISGEDVIDCSKNLAIPLRYTFRPIH